MFFKRSSMTLTNSVKFFDHWNLGNGYIMVAVNMLSVGSK